MITEVVIAHILKGEHNIQIFLLLYLQVVIAHILKGEHNMIFRGDEGDVRRKNRKRNVLEKHYICGELKN